MTQTTYLKLKSFLHLSNNSDGDLNNRLGITDIMSVALLNYSVFQLHHLNILLAKD